MENEVIIDVQGYKIGKKFIVKELAALRGDKLAHYVFQPPFPSQLLNPQDEKQVKWDKPRINIVSDVIIRPANSKLIKNDETQFEQFAKSSLNQSLREDCLEEDVIECSQLSVKEKQLANHAVANIVQIVDEDDDDSMVIPSSQSDSELSFSLPFTQYLAQHGIENDYSDDISLTLIDQFINEDEAAFNPVVDEGTCPINNSITDELNVFDNDMVVVVEEPPISPSPPLPPQSPFVEPVFTRPVTLTSPEAAPAILTQPPMIISQDIIDALSEPWVEVENIINGNVEHPPQPNSPIIEENDVLPERLVVVEAENNIIRSPQPSPPPSPIILSQGVNDMQQPSLIDALAEPWVEERRQGEEMDVENDIIQPSQLSPILGQINNRIENRVEGGDDDDDEDIIPPTPPHSRSRRRRRPRKPRRRSRKSPLILIINNYNINININDVNINN
ncbi:hypothetical protein TcasGA2_TC005151 [Tribolium castaneum]|uniref:Uncharacterized protein n=1 Tax=Tribolium castaneum TaxID=7070 RepID=D7ELS4_TRICA|nr:hypothetical protein TcasGA2_TC005151 [Tribolium castaneum]